MFDSHCHLTDARFADDVDDVIDRAWAAGLAGIVTIASDLADARLARDLARREPRLHCTAGIHPHAAAHVASAAGAEGARAQLSELLGSGDFVAVGETGLDFHYDNSPRDCQRAMFEMQLGLAAEFDLPVIVHSRSADDDTAAMIRAAAGARGVLHCFAGGQALFDAAMEADWYVSFAGLITFRNFDNAALLRATPADRLLLETDSPYLAPVPHRGRRNEPAYVVETCRAAAAVRGSPVAVVASETTANALRFYGLAAPARA